MIDRYQFLPRWIASSVRIELLSMRVLCWRFLTYLTVREMRLIHLSRNSDLLCACWSPPFLLFGEKEVKKLLFYEKVLETN